MNTGINGSNGQSQAADLHVQEVIRSAERELHELLERRAELMKRIGTIKQTLAGLANIFGDCVLSEQLLTFLDRKSSSRQPGFTRACRVVLMEAKKPLGARLVCVALQQRFPEVLERHKDPIASVTTVLNRLADYTEKPDVRSMPADAGCGNGSLNVEGMSNCRPARAASFRRRRQRGNKLGPGVENIGERVGTLRLRPRET